VHNIDYLHHLFPAIPDMLKEFIVGLAAGIVAVVVVTLVKKVIAIFKKITVYELAITSIGRTF